MSNIIKRSFNINLSVMTVLYLYPPEKPTFLYKLQSYIAYMVFAIPVPSLSIIYFILEGNKMDIIRATDNAFSLIEIVCAVIKLSPFITNGEKMKKCIDYFENSFFQVSNEKQTEIMDDCIKTCRRNSIIFICVIGGGIALWGIKPLILEDYNLPIDMWLPFDLIVGTRFYYAFYFGGTLGVFYCAYGDGAIDPLIAGLAYHTAAQIKILKDNLQHLYEYADEEISINKSNKTRSAIIYEKIKKCVIHHNAILHFSKEYEDCFSLAIFIQLVGSVFLIGFCCLQLSVMQELNFNSFSLIMYFNVILIQIYYYCYYGTILFDESMKLTEAIYMGKWYEYDMKSKQALLIMMERSKKPIITTAGKLLMVSLETFTTILRRAYSLLAVLKTYS